MKISLKTVIAMLLVAAFVFSIAGCKPGSNDPAEPTATEVAATATPEATEEPEDEIVITTPPPAETETPSSPTVLNPDKFVDLVKGNQYCLITASSTEGGHEAGPLGPGSAFDEDIDTRWSSEQNDVDGAWIGVEFGYPVKLAGFFVNEVKIWGNVGEWEAQYFSEAKGDWVTFYDEYTFEDDEFYGLKELTEETYKVRLLFHESSSLAVSLYEVQFLGEFVEVEDGTPPRVTKPLEDVPGIPSGLTNFALSGTYAASSSENEGNENELGPDLCFDEDDETRWSSVFGDLYEAWISVDFGKEVKIVGFSVNEVSNWGHVTSYTAEVMKDGEWVVVHEGGEFSGKRDVYVPLSMPATGTAFRLVFHDGQTQYETVTISEIQVLG